MAMAFLVGADRHFRDMRVHGAVGEHEHDVGAAGAAIAPGLQFDAGEIGNEIGFPHVVAGAHGNHVALAVVVGALAGSLHEGEVGVEHELFVVKHVQNQRQVGRGDEQRPLAPAGVEVAVLGVERNGEQRLRPPFKAAFAAVGKFELRRAGALEHIVDVFVEVALRRGRAAWRDVEQEHVAEVAAALQVHGGAFDAIARPQPGFDLEEIDAVILGDREAFAGDPVEIGVDAIAGGNLFVHGFLFWPEIRRRAVT